MKTTLILLLVVATCMHVSGMGQPTTCIENDDCQVGETCKDFGGGMKMCVKRAQQPPRTCRDCKSTEICKDVGGGMKICQPNGGGSSNCNQTSDCDATKGEECLNHYYNGKPVKVCGVNKVPSCTNHSQCNAIMAGGTCNLATKKCVAPDTANTTDMKSCTRAYKQYAICDKTTKKCKDGAKPDLTITEKTSTQKNAERKQAEDAIAKRKEEQKDQMDEFAKVKRKRHINN